MTTGAAFTTSSHYYYRDLGAPLAYPFSMMCWWDALSATATERQLIAVYDPTKSGLTSIMQMGLRTSLAVGAVSYDDAAGATAAVGPAYSVGPYFMVTVNFGANNNRMVSVNGATFVTQTSVRNIASPTRIGLSTRIGANTVHPFNGNIYQAAWASRSLIQEEATALAQGMSPLELGASLFAYLPVTGLTALDVMTGGAFTASIAGTVADTAPPNLHHEWLI